MRERHLTEAQVAARDERRARFKGYAAEIAKMSEEEKADLASRISPHTVEGRPLSLTNCLLLALQLPACTIVGGFRQWLKSGRAVMKGQRGAMIWAPCGKAEGAEEEGDSVRFITITVFDVSQTEVVAA